MRIPTLGLGLPHIATMRSIARGLAPLFRAVEVAGFDKRQGIPALMAIERAIGTEFVNSGFCELSAEFVVLHVKARIIIIGVPTVRIALTMEKHDGQVVVAESHEATGWGIV